MKSLYETLNVPENATQEEIKKAYHELSKKNHPDKKGKTENMQKINHAHIILKDPEKRKRYDETGDENQVNNDNDLIMQAVNSIVDAFIKNPPDDILYAISQIRSSNEEDLNSQVTDLKTKIAEIHEFKKRILKIPEDSNDYIGRILDNRISGLENQIKSLDKKLELFLKALDIFEQYEFEDVVNSHEDVFSYYLRTGSIVI